jgi:prepilin-type N-terminal cleavage/methylation domain-containing protein
MRRRPSIRSRQAGFTLVELLVTIIVGGIFATGLFAFFFAGTDAARTQQSQATAQSDARAAIDRLTRDLRQTVSPDGGNTPPVALLSPTEIVFYLDTNRSATAIVPVAARVRYAIVGGDLIREVAFRSNSTVPYTYAAYTRRETLVRATSQGSVPLFRGIEAGGSTLSATLVPPQSRAIQQVTVRLIAGYRTGNSPTKLEFTTDVTLRNPTV